MNKDLPVPRAPNIKKLCDFVGLTILGIIIPNCLRFREYGQFRSSVSDVFCNCNTTSFDGATSVKSWNKVNYWAEGDYEVDFVVEHLGQIISIEVKSNREKRATSLDKFLKKFPKAKTLFITKENLCQV